MQPGETGRVTKVIDGDGLILDTGQRVRLISIMAPVLSPREGSSDPFAGESARMLEDMALGRRVRLYYPGLTRDRYDRALAHVVTIDAAGAPLWLNREMIARGGARVRLYGSTATRGQDLLAAERTARVAERGLWALSAYEAKDASTISPDARGYTILTVVLGGSMELVSDDRFPPACRRQLQGTTLVLAVDEDARSACGIADGTAAEVRGWLSGETIELRHPLHLSIEDGD